MFRIRSTAPCSPPTHDYPRNDSPLGPGEIPRGRWAAVEPGPVESVAEVFWPAPAVARSRLAQLPPPARAQLATVSNTTPELVPRLSARRSAASTMPQDTAAGCSPWCCSTCRRRAAENLISNRREFPCGRNASFDSQHRNARSCQQTLRKRSGNSGVVCKPEVVRLGDRPPRDNPRVVVTNLSQARRVVQKVYCAGGDIENRIKEQRLHRVLVAENRSPRMPGTGSSTHSPTRAR